MNDYYKIESHDVEGDEHDYCITLLPDNCVYAGHFPGNPVSPGVCNIQMIKECAELLSGQSLFLAFIDKCRFSAVITPQTTPQLRLRLRLSETEATGNMKPAGQQQQLYESGRMGPDTKTYKVHAFLYDEITTYIEFKGEFVTNTMII